MEKRAQTGLTETRLVPLSQEIALWNFFCMSHDNWSTLCIRVGGVNGRKLSLFGSWMQKSRGKRDVYVFSNCEWTNYCFRDFSIAFDSPYNGDSNDVLHSFLLSLQGTLLVIKDGVKKIPKQIFERKLPDSLKKGVRHQSSDRIFAMIQSTHNSQILIHCKSKLGKGFKRKKKFGW